MIDRVNSSLLRAAVERVLEQCASEPGFSPGPVREGLHLLVVALETQPPSLPELPSPGGSLLSLQLLERIRTEVISLLHGGEAPGSLDGALPLLRAIECVQAKLRSSLPNGHGATLFGQPYTPELVVELAHDLRSPLTSILFLSETLRQGQSGEVNSLQHRQLGIIYSAALSLVSMAGDVIEYARAGEQLSDKRPTPFSVSEMLGSIVDLVLPMAEERGVELRTLPPARDQLLGYPVPLSRVLLNLTTNALKATEDGFVEIAVRELGATQVEFAVRDTGPGMDEETQKHLFEPFRSKNASTLGFSGAGLGLSICRKLVAAMGGELQYETAKGWGTRFCFTLEMPLAAAG